MKTFEQMMRKNTAEMFIAPPKLAEEGHNYFDEEATANFLEIINEVKVEASCRTTIVRPDHNKEAQKRFHMLFKKHIDIYKLDNEEYTLRQLQVIINEARDIVKNTSKSDMIGLVYNKIVLTMAMKKKHIRDSEIKLRNILANEEGNYTQN